MFMLGKINIVKCSIKICFLIGIIITESSCDIANTLHSSQIYNEGYVIDMVNLETVPVGSSREQTLLALGSPSMTAMHDDEVFYYMSQTRYRSAQFMKPKITNRRILAIYFNRKGKIARIANYGLQDGKLFDFVSRTTPTSGNEQSFLVELLNGSKAMPMLTTYQQTPRLPL